MKKFNLYLVSAVIVIFIAVMLVLAYSGKSRQAPVKVNPAFRTWVQAFTSGTVSTGTTIKVRLTDDFADTAIFNMPLTETCFKFTPAIAGKSYWSDSRMGGLCHYQ